VSESKPTNQRQSAAAIAHQPGAPDRPRVVAKGKGAVAEQILELAFAHGVKVREDSDLVQLLDAVELDCEIPLPALAAVAEILTRVYQANAAMRGKPYPE
jgi:flagellar biosynthesis protein